MQKQLKDISSPGGEFGQRVPICSGLDETSPDHRISRTELRVLYINPFLTRFDFWTGVRGRRLVQELSDAGAEVVTFPAIPDEKKSPATGFTTLARRTKQYVKTRVPLGWLLFLVEIHLFLHGLMRTVIWSWRIWWQRRRLRPDVVLARTLEHDLTPRLVARVLKRPLILEVHSPFYLERQMRGRSYSGILRRIECAQWRCAERLWTHTEPLAKIITDNQVVSDRVRCIPFGVGPEQLAQRQRNRSDTTLRVIFVGSFYPWHGIEILLSAFSIARARDNRLRLCLVGDGVARSTSERQVRALGLDNAVEFTGWLPQEKVIEYVNKADIGVAPYLKLEPFYFEPVKVLDYMAAGLPIIASAQGQICEMLEHRRSGLLVPPGEVSCLAEAIIELAQNWRLRKRLGEAASERVACHYTWKITIQRVMSLLEDAAKSRRLRSA